MNCKGCRLHVHYQAQVTGYRLQVVGWRSLTNLVVGYLNGSLTYTLRESGPVIPRQFHSLASFIIGEN
jgi:hypothetical protein